MIISLVLLVLILPATFASAKLNLNKDALLSMIATQMSRDGRINANNSKLLQQLLQKPDQPCHAVPFQQTIKHDKCPKQVRTIQNKMCFGHCTSRTDPMVNTESKKTITTCVPDKLFKKVVTFENCEDGKDHVTEIQIINSCKCSVKQWWSWSSKSCCKLQWKIVQQMSYQRNWDQFWQPKWMENEFSSSINSLVLMKHLN